MTDQPPDWVIRVPSTSAVHAGLPLPGMNLDNSGLEIPCLNLIGGTPAYADTLNYGAGEDAGVVGGLVGGSQTVADTLCGMCIGSPSTGATPTALLDQATNTSNAVTATPMVSGLISDGQQNGSQGNLVLDGYTGSMGMLNVLFEILSICGCTPHLAPDTATPEGVITAAATATDAFNANPAAKSVLTAGQSGGSSGNLAVDALGGGQKYANSAHLLLKGKSKTDTTGGDLLSAGTGWFGRNTSKQVNAQALLPATAVSLKDQNLLVAQDFRDAYTMPDADFNWSWDGTDGDESLGCARCDCDGTQNHFVSNEIDVIPGEPVEVTCRVKGEHLVYTGSDPIALGVVRYRRSIAADGGIEYTDLGSVTVKTLTNPPANFVWEEGELAGVYTVPSGVDQLRFWMRPKETITSGVVKWDNCYFLKTDLIADVCVPGVGYTTDDIVRQLYGQTGENFTHNDRALALANTATTLSSVAARVAALEAEGSLGSIAGDDFNWQGEITASANWGGGYTKSQSIAKYQANGVNAEWVRGPVRSTTQDCWFDWQGSDETSDTDYQLIQLVLSSPPVTKHNFEAYIDVYGRVAADWTSWVRARFGSDGTWNVSYLADGVVATMKSGMCVVPGLGSVISLYCGDAAAVSPRHFKLVVGGDVISEFDEAGTDSHIGVSNRKWGWGGRAEGGLFYALITFGVASAEMPLVNQWLGIDQ